MNYARYVLYTLLALAPLAAACGAESTETEHPRLDVTLHEPDRAGDAAEDPLSIATGEHHEYGLEAREAALVFFKGIVRNNRQAPYAMEHLRTVATESYVDLDPIVETSHWITRAEIVGEDGQVLWSAYVNTLFQQLEYLTLLLEQNASVPFSPLQVYRLVDLEYPSLTEFAVRVPTAIEGAHELVFRLPNDAGELIEVGRFAYEDLLADVVPPRFEAEVLSLVENGPSSDRIDVVIMADGYTEAERSKFELDAQATAQRLLETSPMKEHADLFNIRAIWTPSNESGAGYDCLRNQADCVQGFRDTAFETVFVIPAIGDRFNMDMSNISDRVAMPLQIGKIMETAALTSFDEVILLSNSQKRAGFAGMFVALVTSWNRASFPDVAVHEFGHTFGILGDEYQVSGDPCFFAEPRIPLPANISATSSYEELKWASWLRPGTPLPTSPTERDLYPVGAYRGTYNCDFLYRPSFECKMNSSEQGEFCPVCTEQMVRRMYSFVDVTAHAPVAIERLDSSRVRFRVPMHEGAESRYRVEWQLGDEIISTDPVLDLMMRPVEVHGPDGEWVELVATVTEKTGFVRVDDPRLRQTYRWWVRAGR